MTAIAHAISAALLHFVWEGLALALLSWTVVTIMRNCSPRLRYAVSCAALLIMIALPLITAFLLYRSPGMAPARPLGLVDVDGATPPQLLSPAVFPRFIAALEAWALPVWSAGVLIFALRLILSARYVSRLRRAAEPAEGWLLESASRLMRHMNIATPVRVLVCRLIDGPVAVGWLRPAILVPAATLLQLSPAELEAVLAHELAHIRRHDYIVNLLQSIAETLFFYQPAVWWLSSRIRTERELCCDDLVVEICGDPIEYARALTRLERLRVDSPEPAMAATAGPLLYRIQRLTGALDAPHASKAPAAVALILAIIGVGATINWAKAQSPQGAGEPTVHRDAIWADTVKFGDLPIMVRAPGAMTSAATATLNAPEAVVHEVRVGQSASLDLHGGIMLQGKVTQLGVQVVGGTVPVTVQLQRSLPEAVGQQVDGVIHVGMLKDVVYVGRPVAVAASSDTTLFKLQPDGASAIRVKVRFGGASVNSIQVLEGLQVGDHVILSDMSSYEGYDHVRVE